MYMYIYMHRKPRNLFIQKLYFGFFQTFKVWKKVYWVFDNLKEADV